MWATMQDKLHYLGACKVSPVVWVCDDRVNLHLPRTRRPPRT